MSSRSWWRHNYGFILYTNHSHSKCLGWESLILQIKYSLFKGVCFQRWIWEKVTMNLRGCKEKSEVVYFKGWKMKVRGFESKVCEWFDKYNKYKQMF